jgi:hypothetical protein
VGIDRRRESRLNVEPRTGILAVGHKTSLLDPQPDQASVVRAYVDLVLSQRSELPTTRSDLRDLELSELARALQLPSTEVEALVAEELDRRFQPVAEAPAKRRFFKRG